MVTHEDIELRSGGRPLRVTLSSPSGSAAPGQIALVIPGSGPIDVTGRAAGREAPETGSPYAQWADALCAKGLRVLRYRKSFIDTTGAAGLIRSLQDEYRDDLAAVRQYAATCGGSDEVVAFAHSLGALAALSLPELAFAAVSCIAPPVEKLSASFRRQLTEAGRAGDAAAVEKVLSESSADADRQIAGAHLAYWRDVDARDVFGELQRHRSALPRVLFAHGTADPLLPIALVREARAQRRGAEQREFPDWVEVVDGDHFLLTPADYAAGTWQALDRLLAWVRASSPHE